MVFLHVVRTSAGVANPWRQHCNELDGKDSARYIGQRKQDMHRLASQLQSLTADDRGLRIYCQSDRLQRLSQKFLRSIVLVERDSRPLTTVVHSGSPASATLLETPAQQVRREAIFQIATPSAGGTTSRLLLVHPAILKFHMFASRETNIDLCPAHWAVFGATQRR